MAIALRSDASVSEPRTDGERAAGHPDDALRDLAQAGHEALENDYPEPSALARGHAERLLRAMHRILPHRYEIYPTMDGEIALDAFSGNGRSVIVLCETDGGAACLVNIEGMQRSEHYEDAGSLPNSFLRQALGELARYLD